MNTRIILAILGCILALNTANAQSYTEHLQTQQNGTGKVTVNQSKELEALINGGTPTQRTATSKPSAAKPTSPAVDKRTTTAEKRATTADKHPASTTTVETKSPDHVAEKPAATREVSRRDSEDASKRVVRREKTVETAANDASAKASESHNKKVMKGTHKVKGYRIQVYSGGNSRADREKAQQIGNRIKAAMPGTPIFVHFYSPSWKCRVGNYVDISDAKSALRRIRGLGYSQAVIVKGMISVM